MVATRLYRIRCENCGHLNRPGMMLCAKCERTLGAISGIETQTFDLQTVPELDIPLDTAEIIVGGLHGTSYIEFRFDNEMPPLKVELDGRDVMIGRYDPARHITPDVDLTKYGAVTKGVSRCHALIRRDGDNLYIQDLGSANGTHVNGRQLRPHQPHPMTNGDRVQLGRLEASFAF